MKPFFVFFMALLAFGCSDQETGYERFDKMVGAKRHAEFDINQYRPYMKKGKSRIEGKFCIALDNGRKKCPPDQLVLLNPVTDYSTEWFERYWKNGELLESPNDEAARRSKMVRTNKYGRFVFSSLPPGEYYVAAVACPYSARDSKKIQPFNYQRWGAKVTVDPEVKSVKAVLEKVLEYDR
ncbi:MAG: carboxypeptidase regulatory-like domain-containing protein [Alphaproteobacteria bacterium]|nr:carboxypeptidase regulatory-like domain-containing protein [Alphaproteobacteria bacterium]